ncbi:MAG: TIGR03960 family B12-binding radical SAM protein [Deltaproteobacteria bacterium]|nr:TIGR03960 family B12-binding radical SAM protein [Deltaproteobacteria bacterium]
MKPEDLLKISKPSRYIGGELNSVVKDPDRVKLKFALAFPDVYEVGMSHLGFQILYHLLNENPAVACERAFAPWPDMEKLLREKSLPLCSLESSRPLREFDVLGFSLQYELNYTGVLNILDLAGIPLRAGQRREGDPLVIGGGPCTLNPEPLADFFDLFLLGDGEEAVLEICREIIAPRHQGEKKEALLERMTRIQGVYVPSFFRPEYEVDGRIREMVHLKNDVSPVTRRILPDLEVGAFPSRPILPFMEVIHDRLNIEIARGCTRGCRFCQAGMIYRPLRERSPRKILDLVKAGLENTGYDEVSLLSLSTGDYSCIDPLISSILEHTRAGRIALSFPSLRVETLTPSLIQRVQEVRKTGFTLAPEAGTERLRRVINKGNTEEDLLSTIQQVFSANWRLVKLYFMIGLPTEGEEDLEGMVSLCRKALQVARRSKGSAQINLSVSTFIPKAHTPFQWEAQCSMEEVQKKHQFLRKKLDRHGLNFRWTDPRLSFLEGIFARGDRKLGRVLETAYSLGCRLDGWGEHFRYELWEKAFPQAGVEPSIYPRKRDLDEVLPWDHLDSRVSKSFLREERERALQALPTPDCRQASCNGCGVCFGADALSNRIASGEDPGSRLSSSAGPGKNASFPVRRFRCRLTKLGPAKFLGHLEFSQLLNRAFRRAKVPLAYSQGFHPLPKIAFGPPLPVGYESWAEYVDFQVQGRFLPEEAILQLNRVLPQGVEMTELREIPLKSPSIFDNIYRILYNISMTGPADAREEKIGRFEKAESFPVIWSRKSRSIDLKIFLASVKLVDDTTIQLQLRFGPEGTLRPEEALTFIFGWSEEERPPMSIRKMQVHFRDSEPCPAKS